MAELSDRLVMYKLFIKKSFAKSDICTVCTYYLAKPLYEVVRNSPKIHTMYTSDEQEDQARIEAIRKGGIKAAGFLYGETRHRTFIWLEKRGVLEIADRDDIFQESVEALCERLTKPKPLPPVGLNSYFFGIIKNKMSQFFAGKKRNRILSKTLADQADSMILPEEPDDERDDNLGLSVELQKALEPESEENCRILILKHVYQWPIEDIIKEFPKLSSGTIRSRLYDIRKRIKHRLRGEN